MKIDVEEKEAANWGGLTFGRRGGPVHAWARCIGRFGRQVSPSCRRDFSEPRLHLHSVPTSSNEDIRPTDPGNAVRCPWTPPWGSVHGAIYPLAYP